MCQPECETWTFHWRLEVFFALISPLLLAQIKSTDRHRDKLSKSRHELEELELQVLHRSI